MHNLRLKENNICKAWLLITIALCSLFSAHVHASKMASQLQEAIYLFEMKGEVDDAIRLLEKISRQGDVKTRNPPFSTSVKFTT